MIVIFAVVSQVGGYLGVRFMGEFPEVRDVLLNTGTEFGDGKYFGVLTVFAFVSWALLDLDDAVSAADRLIGKADSSGSVSDLVKEIFMVFIGSFLAGMVYYGLSAGSPYAVDPVHALGYLVGLIAPDLEWFFNEYLYDVIMYVVQIVAMGGIVNWLIAQIVGHVISVALGYVLS